MGLKSNTVVGCDSLLEAGCRFQAMLQFSSKPTELDVLTIKASAETGADDKDDVGSGQGVDTHQKVTLTEHKNDYTL